MLSFRLSNFLCCVLLLVSTCAAPLVEEETNVEFVTLDEIIDTLLLHDSIPGISIAVFNDREILYQRAAGARHRGDSLAVNANTLFEAASLSKTVTAYLAADLVTHASLAYDRTLHPYFVDADLVTDERHQELTPRILLSHQSGLPNWRGRVNNAKSHYDSLFQPTDTLAFQHDPGQKFSYSGEGYLYLQQALEVLQKQPFEELAKERIFAPLQLKRSSFLCSPEQEENYATAYRQNGKVMPKGYSFTPLAAASLHTTAEDYARFMIDLVRQAEEHTAFAELFQPQVEVLRHDLYSIHWGLGVGLIIEKDRKYAFHWGDNFVFKSYYIYSFADKLGLVYFVNQENGLAFRDVLVQAVLDPLPPMYPDNY